MRRRAFLVTFGGGICTASGCLERRSGDASSEIRVDTEYYAGDVLRTGSSEPSPASRGLTSNQAQYHLVIDEPGTAERQIADIESVSSFVAATEFEESYLVVVQNAMGRGFELELTEASRDDGTLRLDVSVTSSGTRDDAGKIHSLLVRVTEPERTTRDDVSVDIDGYE